MIESESIYDTQHYLNIFLNTIITEYFQLTRCILNVFSSNSNINLRFVPQLIFILNSTITRHLYSSSGYQCRDIIIANENVWNTLEQVEFYIQRQTTKDFSQRKYILINLDANSSLPDVSTVEYLNYIRDLLILQAANDKFVLYTHVIGSDNKITFELLDVWYFRNESFMMGNSLFPDKNHNQEGRMLRVGSLDYIPYVINEDELGSELSLLKAFSEHFNFTLRLFTLPEDVWGNMYANWTGTGIMGQLLEDLHDIICGGMFPLPKRLQFCDNTMPTGFSQVRVLVPEPRIHHGWFSHYRVFHIEVWCGLFTTLTIVIIARIFARLSKTKHSLVVIVPREIFNGLAMLVNQSQKDDKFISYSFYRFMIGIGSLTFLCISAAYSSRLLGQIILPKFSGKLSTVEEMVNANLRWADQDGEWVTSIATDTSPVYQKLVSLFETHTTERLKELVYKVNYAYPVELVPSGGYSFGTYFDDKIIRKYEVMNDNIYTVYDTMLLRRNSVLLRQLNLFILKCWESGLIFAWEQYAFAEHTSMQIQLAMLYGKVTIPTEPLEFEHLKGPFALLIIGYILSILIFAIEVHKKLNRC